MLFSQLNKITNGKIVQLFRDQALTTLITDSRKALIGEGAVFFAIGGTHHDGHRFISKLYASGIRQFVVEKPVPDLGPEANILLVDSSIRALQKIAASHRSAMSLPVIGITGSNGKTIIKEWLYQLLSSEYKIAKNPASYNSQLGVPLSVWQIQSHHTLGIFEAGISTVGEMEHLQKVLQPNIGIFTNLGSAHDEGFTGPEEKIDEKLKLFNEVELLIYCKDHRLIDHAVRKAGIPRLSWGTDENASIRVLKEDPQSTRYRITAPIGEFTLELPFSDHASVENCCHCIAMLLHFQIGAQEIQRRLRALTAVAMRLELKEGINRCQIIDDTYNNDLAGLQISLDFLAQQNQKSVKRLILSDIHESGLSDAALTKKISSLVVSSHIQNFVGIGPIMFAYQNEFPPGAQFYLSTEDFLKEFDFNNLHDEAILIKGARVFAFEKIVHRMQRKVHGTVMEIDLGALVHNLNYFKTLIKPSTRVMAMVKAFGYGSGSSEIANVLQYHRVDYLGVAYADEGVDLRKNNISLPIMVMNPSQEGFETLIAYSLEPEVYNLRILRLLAGFLQGRPCLVHIKVDTGMRRLGFDENEISELIALLLKHPNIMVASIFSHLAAADEATHDPFSRAQANRFQKIADDISQRLNYRPFYHILNSSGILRLAEFQFDMVRLGIGLYGIDPTAHNDNLKPVATLKTIISQVKRVPAGEGVGYGLKGKALHTLTTATIPIGYADGFSRAFSHGVGTVLVHGKKAPVIGNVCMDMTMIDITGISAREGDEVLIFGKNRPIQELAQSIGTIPYEILTSTSERIKRVFVAESI